MDGTLFALYQVLRPRCQCFHIDLLQSYFEIYDVERVMLLALDCHSIYSNFGNADIEHITLLFMRYCAFYFIIINITYIMLFCTSVVIGN